MAIFDMLAYTPSKASNHLVESKHRPKNSCILSQEVHAADTATPVSALGKAKCEWKILGHDSLNNIIQAVQARSSSHWVLLSLDGTNVGNVHLDTGSYTVMLASPAAGSSQLSRPEGALRVIDKLSERGLIEAALDSSFNFIETSFANADLESINELLSGINVDRLPSRVLIGMLRATFRANQRLPAWRQALVRVRAKLVADGANHKRMLRGLTAE
jgi:hypothetical protein